MSSGHYPVCLIPLRILLGIVLFVTCYGVCYVISHNCKYDSFPAGHRGWAVMALSPSIRASIPGTSLEERAQ